MNFAKCNVCLRDDWLGALWGPTKGRLIFLFVRPTNKSNNLLQISKSISLLFSMKWKHLGENAGRIVSPAKTIPVFLGKQKEINIHWFRWPAQECPGAIHQACCIQQMTRLTTVELWGAQFRKLQSRQFASQHVNHILFKEFTVRESHLFVAMSRLAYWPIVLRTSF